MGFDHYARECEFGILKKKRQSKTKKKRKIFRLCFWSIEECPKLLSSLGIDHLRRKTIPLWNSLGKKRASLYVWDLQYWALCDALVYFKLWARVRYLSFSIDTSPECILWKRSREGQSVWPFKLVKHLADITCVFPISCRFSGLLSSELSLRD